MGFNIHILSGRRPSQNLAAHAAVAASFNPDSQETPHALDRWVPSLRSQLRLIAPSLHDPCKKLLPRPIGIGRRARGRVEDHHQRLLAIGWPARRSLAIRVAVLEEID